MEPLPVDHRRFCEAFRGRFIGLLSWEQLESLWSAVRRRAGVGWYLYAVDEAPPSAPAGAEQVQRFISEIDALLRREHDEDYCGIVYADDMSEPTFIEIFDPNNLGVSCGCSDKPPLPGWIMSLIPPTDLRERGPLPTTRRYWWQRRLAFLSFAR